MRREGGEWRDVVRGFDVVELGGLVVNFEQMWELRSYVRGRCKLEMCFRVFLFGCGVFFVGVGFVVCFLIVIVWVMGFFDGVLRCFGGRG